MVGMVVLSGGYGQDDDVDLRLGYGDVWVSRARRKGLNLWQSIALYAGLPPLG